MDDLSEERLALVNPILADKVRIAANMLWPIVIRVVQGLRSWSQQADLWQQGRILDPSTGLWSVVGKTVTNCPGGHSWHNYGLAVDVAPNDESQPIWKPDWNAEHPNWKRIHEVALSIGLVCGSDFRTFPDNPHLQLTGRFPANPDKEAQGLFREAGMEAVWREAQLI